MKKSFYYWIFLIGFVLYNYCWGTVWERQAADSSGSDLGEYCDLALDSQDNPHIAYYDWVFLDLRYAYYENGAWHIEIVDSVGKTGKYCSIALDAQNRPHISYWLDYLGDYPSLGYAVRTDTGWAKTIVDTGRDTTYEVDDVFTGIVINSQGYPEISYARRYPSQIMYAYQDASGWHKVPIHQLFGTDFTKIRLSSQGHPVIGFSEYFYSSGVEVLKAAYLNPADSTWNIVTVPDSGRILGYNMDFDLDSQDRSYFIYTKNYWQWILAVYDGSGWQMDSINYHFEDGVSLAINRQDKPSLAGLEHDRTFWGVKENGQWQFQLVDDGINPEEVSLVFDSQNLPRLAVYGHTLNYSRYALFYYRYWLGDPLIFLPQPSHDFGTVWTQSYADWNCPVVNNGDAPLILRELNFTSPWWDTTFQVVNTPLSQTILPQQTGTITIRFKPFTDATYFDTLLIISNDTLSPDSLVMVQGSGTSSGIAGNLLLGLQNIYLDHAHQMLKSDQPLREADVSLYQGGVRRYGPLSSDPTGQVNFANVNVGDYDLKIKRWIRIPGDQPQTTILDSLILIKSLSIGPGANTYTFAFPESLFVEKYYQIYDLTHIEKTYWDYSALFSYGSEIQVRSLLNQWKSALPPDVEQSLGRLMLTERMTHQLFDAGYSMGTEFVCDVGELINLIFYSDQYIPSLIKVLIDFFINIITGDPLGAIVNLVLEAIESFLQMRILDLIGEGIQQAAAYLPQVAQEWIMAAWHDITAQYSGWAAFLGSFSAPSWNHMKGLIFHHFKTILFQNVYIDLLTDDQIFRAKTYSQNFQYNGEFTEAYQDNLDFIADKQGDIEISDAVCEDLRMAANLFGIMSSILDILGIFPVPGLDLLEALQTAMKISAYMNVLPAVGISAYEFFSLPEDMDDATERIYFPEGILGKYLPPPQPLAKAKVSALMLAKLKENLHQAVVNYDSTIALIKNHIQNRQNTQAIIAMQDLMNAELELRNQMKTTLAPIYSVAAIARDSLANFPAQYDSLIANYAIAGEERFMDYLAILFLPTDTSQAMRQAVINQLDQSLSGNQRLSDQIVATLDTVSVLEMPAIVVASVVKQNVYKLDEGQTGTITLQLQNPGALPAEGVRVVLRTNPALQIKTPDSVYVGTLAAGDTSATFTWQVTPFGSGFNRGTWYAEIQSSNAKTYSASGAFVVPMVITPSTGGKLSNENIYCYPNPFNPEVEVTHLRYSLAKTAEVTIKIFDAGGNQVKTVIDAVLQTAAEEQNIEWDGRNGEGRMCDNGVYFFVVESSEGERAVGKIAVIR